MFAAIAGPFGASFIRSESPKSKGTLGASLIRSESRKSKGTLGASFIRLSPQCSRRLKWSFGTSSVRGNHMVFSLQVSCVVFAAIDTSFWCRFHLQVSDSSLGLQRLFSVQVSLAWIAVFTTIELERFFPCRLHSQESRCLQRFQGPLISVLASFTRFVVFAGSTVL